MIFHYNVVWLWGPSCRYESTHTKKMDILYIYKMIQVTIMVLQNVIIEHNILIYIYIYKVYRAL